MHHILIVSGSFKMREKISSLLDSLGEIKSIGASSIAEAKGLTNSTLYDLVLIGPPFGDDQDAHLALHLAETTRSGILLLVGGGRAETIARRIAFCGVHILPLPANKSLFLRAVKSALAVRGRMERIHNESFRAQNKIDDLRRIDLAKHALIERRAMTEPEAHRFIEKQAMDRRMTRRKIAEEILRALPQEKNSMP